MRQVVGKATRDIDAGAFAELRAPYPSLLVDIGTGDGKHVLATARRNPATLVVGVDAEPARMRPAAARANAKPARGGVPNAVFVWASAEQFPAELSHVDEVHVLMPWGSLLRALVEPDVAVLRRIAAGCTAGARFLITLNLHAWRPPVADVGDTAEPTPQGALQALAEPYGAAGWRLTTAEYLGAAAIAELGTSWTKRLNSSRDEFAVLALRGTIR